MYPIIISKNYIKEIKNNNYNNVENVKNNKDNIENFFKEKKLIANNNSKKNELVKFQLPENSINAKK